MVTLLRPLFFYIELPINKEINISSDAFVSIGIIAILCIYYFKYPKKVIGLPLSVSFIIFLVYCLFGVFYTEEKIGLLIKLGRFASYFSVYVLFTCTLNSMKRIKILKAVIILSYGIFCIAWFLEYQKFDIYSLEFVGITSKNTFGILTTIVSLFMLGWKSGSTRNITGWISNYLLLIIFITILIFSYTRTAWIGFIIGMLIFFIFINKLKFIIIYFLTIIIVIILLWNYISVRTEDLKNMSFYRKEYYQSSLEGRILLYYPQAIYNWKESPIWGHGLGSSKRLSFLSNFIQKPPHNEYLQILQELGIVGIFLYFYLLWCSFVPIFSALKQRIRNVSYELHSILISSMSVFGAFIIMSIGQETFSNGVIGNYFILIISIGHSALLLRKNWLFRHFNG